MFCILHCTLYSFFLEFFDLFSISFLFNTIIKKLLKIVLYTKYNFKKIDLSSACLKTSYNYLFINKNFKKRKQSNQASKYQARNEAKISCLNIISKIFFWILYSHYKSCNLFIFIFMQHKIYFSRLVESNKNRFFANYLKTFQLQRVLSVWTHDVSFTLFTAKNCLMILVS